MDECYSVSVNRYAGRKMWYCTTFGLSFLGTQIENDRCDIYRSTKILTHEHGWYWLVLMFITHMEKNCFVKAVWYSSNFAACLSSSTLHRNGSFLNTGAVTYMSFDALSNADLFLIKWSFCANAINYMISNIFALVYELTKVATLISVNIHIFL